MIATSNSNGFQPKSDGRNGLQPKSDGLQYSTFLFEMHSQVSKVPVLDVCLLGGFPSSLPCCS